MQAQCIHIDGALSEHREYKKGLFSLAIGYSLIGLTLKKVNVNSRWGTRKNEGFVLLGALVAH